MKQNNELPIHTEERACFAAAKQGDINRVTAFIERYGVDAPVDGGTCLHQAVFNGQYALVSFLLKSGANPDALYENQVTPLIAAIDRMHWDIARLLVRQGANVNLKDAQNNSPLSKTIFFYHGQDELIKLLLSRGADPFQDLLDGYRPVDLAESMKLHHLLELFNKHKP